MNFSVIDAGRAENGREYIVMEYCPPPDLGEIARSEPLSVEQALKYAVQVAGAVETIHRAGYLHRDIKPSNILLTEYRRPVLIDFGIAIIFFVLEVIRKHLEKNHQK